MIPKECKRLAEVDFPIAVVSKHSAREKSIRHGHPSTLHLWWARRPLAACRAILLGLLLPDPCDANCPEHFKKKARELLRQLPGKIGGTDSDLQAALLRFIGDFADWENAANKTFLDVGRGLVKNAHPKETPLVVDPFAGGGAIPLEALRIGCDAFASDLNPVAGLILKVMLEDIQSSSSEFIDHCRQVGEQIKATAEKTLGKYYPVDADGSTPIAYIWARTVKCESPNCGAEIPLVRSFWLCKKADRKRALRYTIARPRNATPHLEFEIYEPTSEESVPKGTVKRANATCPCCNIVLPAARVAAQLSVHRGGAEVEFGSRGVRQGGALLLAVVTLKNGVAGRHYRLANDSDYRAVASARSALDALNEDGFLSEALPPVGSLGFRVQRYGMTRWRDLFTSRQALALSQLSSATRKNGGDVLAPISLVIGKLADLSNALCGWIPEVECPSAVFKLGRVKMCWDTE